MNQTYMRIILGVFSDTYYELANITGAAEWTEFSSNFWNNKIIEVVRINCDIAKEIIFDLSSVNLPLYTEKYTCNELLLVLKYDVYLKKTVFYKNMKVVKIEDFLGCSVEEFLNSYTVIAPSNKVIFVGCKSEIEAQVLKDRFRLKDPKIRIEKNFFKQNLITLL